MTGTENKARQCHKSLDERLHAITKSLDIQPGAAAANRLRP